MKRSLQLTKPVSWLYEYDPEPTLLPRRGSSVMVPVCILCTNTSVEAFVLTEDVDLNEVSEAINSSTHDILFFVVPRAAVMAVCPELERGEA